MSDEAGSEYLQPEDEPINDDTGPLNAGDERLTRIQSEDDFDVTEGVVQEDLTASGDRTRWLRVDGIFEGGGALGTAHIGALSALQDQYIWFDRVAGSSSGALIAALVAVGYQADEILWLLSPERYLPRPTSLPNHVTAPLRFLRLIDLPLAADELEPTVRDQAMLWQFLSSDLMTHLLSLYLTIAKMNSAAGDNPTLRAALAQFNEWPLVQGFLQSLEDYDDTCQGAVSGQMTVEDLRECLWEWALTEHPIYLYALQVIYEGGLADGDQFADHLKGLLGARRWDDPDRPVTFRDLPLDLLIVASDSHSRSMDVYSKATTPNMLVAEAVRRSMAVPLAFKPRLKRAAGKLMHEILDGGLHAPYPYWTFLEAGNRLWYGDAMPLDGEAITMDEVQWLTGPDATSAPAYTFLSRLDTETYRADQKRVKLGFVPDDQLDVPGTWPVGPARWHDDALQAVTPESLAVFFMLLNALREINGEAPLPDLEALASAEALGGLLDMSQVTAGQGAIIDRLLRLISSFDGITEKRILRRLLASSAMAAEGKTYHETEIPLKGYHWLDFTINSPGSEAAFEAMLTRAELATLDTLRAAKLDLPPFPPDLNVGFLDKRAFRFAERFDAHPLTGGRWREHRGGQRGAWIWRDGLYSGPARSSYLAITDTGVQDNFIVSAQVRGHGKNGQLDLWVADGHYRLALLAGEWRGFISGLYCNEKPWSGRYRVPDPQGTRAFYQPERWYWLQIAKFGQTVTAYIDGEMIDRFEDSTNRVGGSIGIGTAGTGADFAQVVVW